MTATGPRAPEASRREAPSRPLTVAVTGPTGDIGRSLLARLEGCDRVGRVLGMARRPFDPSIRGWSKTEYRRGDVLDRESVDALVAGADVVVHLAFLIFGGRDETRRVNLQGTRNVLEATVAAGAQRLVYTSSVAAYGFRKDRPHRLTEDMHPEGTGDFYYSAQKAELEAVVEEVVGPSPTQAYVFRPCIVGGCDALLLVDELERHIPVPDLAVDAAAEVVRRATFLPPGTAWVHALRVPSVMETRNAREQLGWEPQHDAAATLRATVECARAEGVVD